MIARTCFCSTMVCRCGTVRYNGNETAVIVYSATVTATGNAAVIVYSATVTATGNAAPTTIYSSRGALELDRQLQLEEFARRAKLKPVRSVVKVDEKKLIAQPRSHAKPHTSQSSRAAMSVRQFAQRVK